MLSLRFAPRFLAQGHHEIIDVSVLEFGTSASVDIHGAGKDGLAQDCKPDLMFLLPALGQNNISNLHDELLLILPSYR